MTSFLPFWRVLAYHIEEWSGSKAPKGYEDFRWPDKSAAVGVGGDASKCAGITAVASLNLLAAFRFYANFSMWFAPSPSQPLVIASNSQ
jgi:hypothetical protein